MMATGFHKNSQPIPIQPHVFLVELDRQTSSSFPMFGVYMLILAGRIVQVGKCSNDVHVASRLSSQHQPVGLDTLPMRDPMQSFAISEVALTQDLYQARVHRTIP